MLFPRFAQFAVAFVLLTIGLAAPVHAQNNKQIISGTWYEDRAQVISASTTPLTLTFAQTPTNQFLNVTNVACSILVASGVVVTSVTLNVGATSGANNLGRNYEIKGSATSETIGSSKYYSITANQIFFKVGPGRFPAIEIDEAFIGSPLTSNASCVIVGNLTDS